MPGKNNPRNTMKTEIDKVYNASKDLAESVVRRGLMDEYLTRRARVIDFSYIIIYNIIPIIFIILISMIVLSLGFSIGHGHEQHLKTSDSISTLQILLVFYEILIAILIFIFQMTSRNIGISYILSSPSYLWILSAWNTVTKDQPITKRQGNRHELLRKILNSRKYDSIQNTIIYNIILILLYLFLIEILPQTSISINQGVAIIIGIIISLPVIIIGILSLGGIVYPMFRFTSTSAPLEIDINSIRFLRRIIKYLKLENKIRFIYSFVIKYLLIYSVILITLLFIVIYFIGLIIDKPQEFNMNLVIYTFLYMISVWFAWVYVRRAIASVEGLRGIKNFILKILFKFFFAILMFNPVVYYAFQAFTHDSMTLSFDLLSGDICRYGVGLNLIGVFILNMIFYMYLRAVSYAPVLSPGLEGGTFSVGDFLSRYAAHVVSRLEGVAFRGGEESVYRRLLVELLILLYFQNIAEPVPLGGAGSRFIYRRIFVNNASLYRISIVMKRSVMTGGLLVPAIAILAGSLLRIRVILAELYEGENVYDHDRLARAVLAHYVLLALLYRATHSMELMDKMKVVLYGLGSHLPWAVDHVDSEIVCRIMLRPYSDILSSVEDVRGFFELHFLHGGSIRSLEREVRRTFTIALEKSSKPGLSIEYCMRILREEGSPEGGC